jgi:hypothetical protein
MKISRIPTLNTYSDWLEKAKYELMRFEESCGVYDMANCFLTLNAIPDWIEKSDTSPIALREVAKSKLAVMRGTCFELDATKMDEIDHQLRLIRLFCNHSKHADKKEKFDHISMSSTFPLTFPVKFEFLSVDSINVKAADILNNVINFWAGEIEGA